MLLPRSKWNMLSGQENLVSRSKTGGRPSRQKRLFSRRTLKMKLAVLRGLIAHSNCFTQHRFHRLPTCQLADLPTTSVFALAIFTSLLITPFFLRVPFSQPEKTRNEHQKTTRSRFAWIFWSLWPKSWTCHSSLFSYYIRSNWTPQQPRNWFPWQKSELSCIVEGSISDPQINAVSSLLTRRFPSLSNRVIFSRQIQCQRNKGGCFSMNIEDGKLCIRGSSGVDLAAAFHWFLKSQCDGMSTWEKTGGTQYREDCLNTNHVANLKKDFKLSKIRNVPLSFYQNIVTSSYSMAYWDWPRWEQEIDWMALHGINLPLALSGQEFIWTKVYKDLGIEFEELSDFFAGPSFLSWGRMGNIQGYAGPLPWSYIQAQSDLQLKIVSRMRNFGMTPVFSGFAGFVPNILLQKFPNTKAKKSSNWCEFSEEYCCVWMLDPQDPLFQKIGSLFVKYQRDFYGSDRFGFYAVDVFNEMVPSQSDPLYLQETSKAVYSAMSSVDSNAVWIMQAWLFYSDHVFWKPPQIKAVLSGVPSGSLLLLDLYAERYPQWKRTQSFYGHPFIWCNLHNFGGNTEMHGAMQQIAQGIADAQMSKANVVGTGMCPEGLEQNPVVYELSSEMAYREAAPNLQEWFSSYTLQRYGGKECPEVLSAWKMLSESVYKNTGHRSETVMDIPISRPGLNPQEAVWGLKPRIWYNPNKVIEAWGDFLNCKDQLGSLSSYQYDLVDTGRQVLSKLATKYWKKIEISYTRNNLAALQKAGDQLLELLEDMNELVSTHKGFLLGPVIQETHNYGQNEEEKQLMERNVKLQVTIWGENPSGDTELSDYANKEWSGLLSSFYRERWKQWIDFLVKDIKQNRPYNSEEFIDQIVQFTHEWISRRESFLIESEGDPVEVSSKLYDKYREEAWFLEVAI